MPLLVMSKNFIVSDRIVFSKQACQLSSVFRIGIELLADIGYV